MPEPKTFEEYCLSKGLNFPKKLCQSEEILNSPERLARIGNMCTEYKEELNLIIEARIAPLQEELLLRAIPMEVPEIRRAVMEIACLSSDIDSYISNRESQIKAEEEQMASKVGVDIDNSQEVATL